MSSKIVDWIRIETKSCAQRIDFQFTSGSDAQRCNQLEQSLLAHGFSIKHSGTTPRPDSLKEARKILSQMFGTDTAVEIFLYAISGRNRVVLIEGWDLVIISSNQRELMRFSAHLVSDLTIALTQFGLRPTEVDSKAPLKIGLIVLTAFSGIFSALSWALVSSIGFQYSVLFTIIVVAATTTYNTVRQN